MEVPLALREKCLHVIAEKQGKSETGQPISPQL